MAERNPRAPDTADAEAALAYLLELSPDVRGCVLLSGDGVVLASTGDAERWSAASAGLLEAADSGGGRPAEQVHVATEDGEVFAVRESGHVAVVVAERFTLASLLVFDVRTVLRDLADGGPRDRRAPLPAEFEPPSGGGERP